MAHIHVGIDISQDTFNAAFRDGESKWHEQSFPNNKAGRRKLLSWAGAGARFTMEATGYYHVETALFLHKTSTVHVCNPMLVKRYSQLRLKRGKTDRADARLIAEFAANNEDILRVWRPLEGRLGEARGLVTAAKQVQKQVQQNRNTIHALKLTEAGKRAALELAGILRVLRAALRGIEAAIAEIVGKEQETMYEGLLSVPGIGPKTAAALIVCTNGFADFANDKQLCAYVGLSPRVFESGTSVKGKGHICKLGNPYLRRCLYMCAVSSMTCNPVMKAYKDSLTARGKHNTVALVAVANKLLRTAFAIAKSGRHWNPEVKTA